MDLIAEWASAQQRVIELMTGLPADRTERFVPACPDWTVRDLLSHMVGLGADVVAGDEPDDHNSEWTQRQVDERRDRDVAAPLDEWRSVTEPLCEWMRGNGARPLGDVIIHEQDLRGALGVPGGQTSAGGHAIRDRFVDRCAARVDGLEPGPRAGLAPLGPPAAVVDRARRRDALPRRVRRTGRPARRRPARVTR